MLFYWTDQPTFKVEGWIKLLEVILTLESSIVKSVVRTFLFDFIILVRDWINYCKIDWGY